MDFHAFLHIRLWLSLGVGSSSRASVSPECLTNASHKIPPSQCFYVGLMFIAEEFIPLNELEI